LVQGHIVAHLGGFTNHDAGAVIDKESPTNHSPWMYLDTGEPARGVT